MFSLYLIISIIGLHYVSDYVFQSSWMASSKSHDIRALFAHVTCYSLTLGLGSFLLGLGGLYNFILPWVIINYILHMIVDIVSSKIAMKFFNPEDLRMVFLVDGFDQCLHYACLFSTFILVNYYIPIIHFT